MSMILLWGEHVGGVMVRVTQLLEGSEPGAQLTVRWRSLSSPVIHRRPRLLTFASLLSTHARRLLLALLLSLSN
jgi:hypothetical protein